MRRFFAWAALSALIVCSLSIAANAADAAPKTKDNTSPDAALTKPQSSVTTGSVSVEGHRINYKAVAGTIVLYGKGDNENTPTASIFYVAYFKQGADASKRPVTFIYNGGPGSASVWLHMGAFGPRRVDTNDHTHTPAAPYKLVNNDYSLLDVSDVVFIDAPATGFSRLIADTSKDKRDALMKKRDKQFFGVDQDGQAFAQFITRFLSRYGRWNSPKYLFGESYGTTRSAVLSNILENQDSVDLNGVILLSQILSFDTSIDGPESNPGIDQPYFLALPTYAATAWLAGWNRCR
jgi:carboxypeptidase C (cathepsin A)